MTARFAPLPEVKGASLRALTEADAPALDVLSAECADFMRMVERRAPTPGDGLETLRATPPDFSAGNKLVIGVYDGAALIGAADLLRGYPEPSIWYIGLLLLTPARRGSGLGGAVYAALRDWARRQGAAAIRLAVQVENTDGLRFWMRQGFVQIGRAQQDLATHVNEVCRMEHRLAG